VRNRSLPPFFSLLIAVVLIICAVVWLASQTGKNLLTNTDELNTAERSREMLLRGYGAVHDNFAISVAKPPLQYWLTGFTLSQFENRELAVRIWPLIYCALTALALGLLAFIVKPERPWLVPLSVALLLTCPLFLFVSALSFLDIGLTFFTTLAIVFAQLARRRPMWWMAVAIAAWLGTLQKIPFVLLVWAIIIFVRWRSERSTLRSRWLLVSLISAAVLIALWPLIQKSIYHVPLREISRVDETIHLIGPLRLGARPFFEVPWRLITLWPCGSLALMAPLILYFATGTKPKAPVAELTAVSLLTVVFAVIFGFRSVRYVLPVVPCLCLLLALCLSWLWAKRRAGSRILVVALLLISISGLEITRRILNNLRGQGVILVVSPSLVPRAIMNQRLKDASDQKLLAEELGVLQKEGTRIVILGAYKNVLSPHFYLFYGNLRLPVVSCLVDELPGVPTTGLTMGVCATRDFSVIQQKYAPVRVQSVHGDFVCWVGPAAEKVQEN
jgi:4-amino-4-deoxy-L-arabinose transferase-like glycosyltransferase